MDELETNDEKWDKKTKFHEIKIWDKFRVFMFTLLIKSKNPKKN